MYMWMWEWRRSVVKNWFIQFKFLLNFFWKDEGSDWNQGFYFIVKRIDGRGVNC